MLTGCPCAPRGPSYGATSGGHLANRVATRLRAKSRPGRTVTVRVCFADLHSVTRSVTLDAPISATCMGRRAKKVTLAFAGPAGPVGATGPAGSQGPLGPRPRGPYAPSRERAPFSSEFISALLRDFRQGGPAAIAKVRKYQPAAYMKICALLVPKEMKLEHFAGVVVRACTVGADHVCARRKRTCGPQGGSPGSTTHRSTAPCYSLMGAERGPGSVTVNTRA